MSDSALDSFKLEYEQMPFRITRKGGKDIKPMSKNTKAVEATEAKTYNKTKGEHFKDIVIAILVTSIIAFVGGMTFQGKQQGAIDTAVKAVTPSVQAQAEVKK